jgi:hypothetical protein
LLEQGVDFQTLVRKKFEEVTAAKGDNSSSPEQVQEGSTCSLMRCVVVFTCTLLGVDAIQEVSLEDDSKGEKTDDSTSNNKNSGALIAVEERQTGGVGWDVYKEYFRACGSLWWFAGE